MKMSYKAKINAVVSSLIIFTAVGAFIFFSGSFINSVNAALSSESSQSYSFCEDAKQKSNAVRIRYVTRNVISILKSRHYRAQKHDDDFSHKVFDKYFDMLDSFRIYFN